MLKMFFFYHASVILVLSVLVITRRNPVHSIVLMLVMFFHIAGIYLFLNAEFLAAIQIIVYAGAILVLFLFVVFLLNVGSEQKGRVFTKYWPISMVASIVLAVVMFVALGSLELGPPGTFTNELIARETHTVALGTELYTKFVFPFEVASIILLVAIIGAIVMGKEELKS